MAYIPHGTVNITESDKSLKGVFGISSEADPFPVSPGVTVRIPYAAQDIPIPNILWNAAHEQKGIASEKGASFVELELAAHAQTAMHSTQSVDLGVIITGEIVLTLDSGEEKILKYAFPLTNLKVIAYNCRTGDLFVQKGATHRWENRTDSPARMVVVVTASREPTIR